MSIRLINATTLRMQTFTGSEIPKYAILSHTWAPEGELDLQDWKASASDPAHAARATSGFDKVVKTCEEALRDGIDWAWVDSCCIDKTSSAELNEAINSMFEWYQKASVCYVLLSDLESADVLDTAKLGRCRWFTRGWCLQELIAPVDLRFYDAGWRFVGSKAGLRDDIGAITGVETEILDGKEALANIPVARRMSWASGRQTTKPEDVAYCLLGIFSINMPMLYGEGGKKAFLRLQHEVIRQNNDLTIFATDPGWTATNVEYSIRDLFAESPREFDSCWLLSSHRRYNVAFSLTNSGVFFPNARLFVSREFKCYFMDLQCAFDCFPEAESDRAEEDGGGGGSGSVRSDDSAYTPSFRRMMLKKVGPGLFVRMFGRSPTYEGHEEPFPGLDGARTKREDVYILTAPTLSATLSLHGHGAPIEITIVGGSNLMGALQDPMPADSWDAASSMFLTEGEGEFRGCIRLYPAMVQGVSRGPGSQQQDGHFYVVCGRSVHGIHPQSSFYLCWARLLSPSTWESLQRRYGEMGIVAAAEMQDGGDVSAASVFVDGNRVTIAFAD